MKLNWGLLNSWKPDRALIIVYHSISSAGNDRWAVKPEAFSRQLWLLSRLGYQSWTFEEFVNAAETGRPIRKVVVITFDDGYLDTVTTAAPLLDAYGFRASVFVLTSLIGERAAWREEHYQVPLASWEQLQTLQRRGWEIGFHSADHSDLSMHSYQDLVREFTDGMRSMEQKLGRVPTSLAYPFGKHSPHARLAAEASGFRAAAAVSRRSHATTRSPRFAMPRCHIEQQDKLLHFLFIVLLGYDLRDGVRARIDRAARAIQCIGRNTVSVRTPPQGRSRTRNIIYRFLR